MPEQDLDTKVDSGLIADTALESTPSNSDRLRTVKSAVRLPRRLWPTDPVSRLRRLIKRTLKQDRASYVQLECPVQSFEAQQMAAKRRITSTWGNFRPDAMESRGTILMAIYQPDAVLYPSTVRTLAEFAALGYCTVVINSVPDPNPLLLAQLQKVADVVIHREGGGRDFSSWLTAILAHYSDVTQSREVILINDSLVGPVRSIESMMNARHDCHADLWGLSENPERAYHLQSSLLSILGSYFASDDFKQFLCMYPFPDDRDLVIVFGEIGISQHALRAGAKLGVLCPYMECCEYWLQDFRDNYYTSMTEDKPQDAAWYAGVKNLLVTARPVNPQHFFWDTMIRHYGYPFLKRELLFSNPAGVRNLKDLPKIVGSDAISKLISGELIGLRPGWPT